MRSTPAVPPRAAEQVAQATPPATPPAPSFDRTEKETPNLDRFRQQKGPLRRADASNETLTRSALAKTEAPPAPKLQAQSADEKRKNEVADTRAKGLAKDAAAPPPTAAAPVQARERLPFDTVAGAGGAVVGGIATPRGERDVLASRAASVPGAPIVSPNPLNRWRILPGGAVQRSTDGGATWQTQSTGVSVTLTAGASPAPLVCWLAGPGGRVLLTVDGATWKQVSLGQPIDLVAIRAEDDKSATVTAADGRTFSTADSGATWTLRP
jgi:hypothetical protein